ncbi:YaaC family protein [Microbacterium aquimaris]|uniref:YaaC family protein n=1 Tax=Microbacterium aquimaris TaxID=459816 RepID=A0ABU5N7T6_9MICO|nr:YaaC family protein [Microbacterium aquimaris]MDZ8162155.1 YaaC family protein [Microbacterium aquimaris]
MTLPPERAGTLLQVKNRQLDFSFFPMTRTNRRWGLNTMLYAAEPWAVISGAIRDAAVARSLPDHEERSALSFVRQAKEYFSAAERAGALETRPLLYYYSFLNLGKAISIARGRPNMVGKVRHGVASVHSAGYLPTSAEIALERSGPGNLSAIDELHWALEGTTVRAGQVKIADLMPQSVVGHRMWRAATGSIRKERFFALQDARWYEDAVAREIWLKIYLRRDTLRSQGRGVTETIREAGLVGRFRAVNDAYGVANDLHAFEQSTATPYTGRASDVVMDSVNGVRRDIWQTITSTDGFRRFYLYLSPANEVRLPQWASTYSLLFWLGSLTRYQPVELLDALAGPYGPFFEEFIETQPAQLLYTFASEARMQDVSKPALV